MIKRRIDAAVVNDDDWRRKKSKEKEWEKERGNNYEKENEEGRLMKMLAMWNKIRQCNYAPDPSTFFTKVFFIRADSTKTSFGGECSSTTHIMVKGPNTWCKVTREKLEDKAIRGIDCEAFFEEDRWHDSFAIVNSCQDVSCEGLSAFWVEHRTLLKWLGERYKAPGEEKAIKYLGDTMKRNRFPSHKETIQTAITALKYLLAEDLKADEIKVYVFGKDRWIDGVLPVEEIEKHLTEINNQSGSVSLSKKKIAH